MLYNFNDGRGPVHAELWADPDGGSLRWVECAITDDQIRALRVEAGAAGDSEQTAICDLALAGDDDARAECATVINDAEAMDDDE